jgi:hypothetical protein
MEHVCDCGLSDSNGESIQSNRMTKSWEIECVPVMLADGVEIVITPQVPVWTCGICGEAHTDDDGAKIRDRYVQSVREAFALGAKREG